MCNTRRYRTVWAEREFSTKLGISNEKLKKLFAP